MWTLVNGHAVLDQPSEVDILGATCGMGGVDGWCGGKMDTFESACTWTGDARVRGHICKGESVHVRRVGWGVHVGGVGGNWGVSYA